MPELVGNIGDTVYVKLDGAEVKRGHVIAARVTIAVEASRGQELRVQPELCVEWLTIGSRKESEWFAANLVFTSPEDAFNGDLCRTTFKWPKQEIKP